MSDPTTSSLRDGLTAEHFEHHLGAIDLLADLPPDALAALAARVTVHAVMSGTDLCSEGQPGDSAFLVVAGRFQATCGGRPVGEIGRGELVGEMSLLTGRPRTATVTAVRNSTVMVLEGDAFTQVLRDHEQCYRSVANQLVGRLESVLTATTTKNSAAIVAVIRDGKPATTEIAGHLIEHLGPKVAVADRGADLAALEANHRVVVLTPHPADLVAQRWALQHCDRALLLLDATESPYASEPARLLVDRQAVRRPELVLVHPASTQCPTGTTQWLDAYKPSAHHHVRRGVTNDTARVARRVTGRERVLVLSGGGARGLAHAGLWQALSERQIDVDAVVGTSAGAVAAAVFALGHDAETAGRVAIELFGTGRGPIDLTVPTMSLASGRRLASRLRTLCGSARTIQDLWLELTVVSSNLTTSDLHLHRTGPLWRALRASTAIPGVFPPLVEPTGVLVDGGLVANLPLDVARRLHPSSTLIASDVGRRTKLSPIDFSPCHGSGRWRNVRSRLRRIRQKPGMIRVLTQVTALGGAGSSQEPADLHIEFDLDRFGMFDFRRGREIIEAGYEQAANEIDANAHRLPYRFATHAGVGPSRAVEATS